MTFWLVGKVMSGEPPNVVWSFEGLFSTESKAIAACKTWRFFVGPVILDVPLPPDIMDWPDAFYPVERKPGDE